MISLEIHEWEYHAHELFMRSIYYSSTAKKNLHVACPTDVIITRVKYNEMEEKQM